MQYDYIIMGSGFGGSVCALRLAEKGYKVLVVEQGKRFAGKDYPKRNWNLRKWLWLPQIGFKGFFRISLFRHITVLAGAGVGGGSLVYANTLPVPRDDFFRFGEWGKMADWKEELMPYYMKASEVLGVTLNPKFGPGDSALETLASEIGKTDTFEPTRVAVYFGEPETRAPDPYFNGEGPEREGCRLCGGCMVGCQHDAKNTLDKNYLHLAEEKGVDLWAETRMLGVEVVSEGDKELYEVSLKRSGKRKKTSVMAGGVIFSGGVLGTIPLLLKLKKSTLPDISDTLGSGVRTNNEALIGVVSRDFEKNYSEGIAIGSILHTDEHSHLEPVRYPSGSGFWRIMMAPMVHGDSFFIRIFRLLLDILRNPIKNLKYFFIRNWAERTSILLFMQTLSSTLRLKRGIFGLRTVKEEGPLPSAFMNEAQDLARKYAKIVNGKPVVLPTESLFGIPTTAHILGGACMGKDKSAGVIDSSHKVFGYKNLYVVDGSSVSANPGVNPSLTIAAMAERAMNLIPPAD